MILYHMLALVKSLGIWGKYENRGVFDYTRAFSVIYREKSFYMNFGVVKKPKRVYVKIRKLF